MTPTRPTAAPEITEQRVSDRVVDAVARAAETDPLSLTPPLYEAVDPDALDELCRHSDFEGTVTFDYLGYRVAVDGAGRVTVEEDARGDAVDGTARGRESVDEGDEAGAD